MSAKIPTWQERSNDDSKANRRVDHMHEYMRVEIADLRAEVGRLLLENATYLVIAKRHRSALDQLEAQDRAALAAKTEEEGSFLRERQQLEQEWAILRSMQQAERQATPAMKVEPIARAWEMSVPSGATVLLDDRAQAEKFSGYPTHQVHALGRIVSAMQQCGDVCPACGASRAGVGFSHFDYCKHASAPCDSGTVRNSVLDEVIKMIKSQKYMVLRPTEPCAQERVLAQKDLAASFADWIERMKSQPAAPHPVMDNKSGDVQKKYDELIYAVGMKHPGESRHETALRYIRKAEAPQNIGSETAKKESK